jgi:spoIIIJ-associated protein
MKARRPSARDIASTTRSPLEVALADALAALAGVGVDGVGVSVSGIDASSLPASFQLDVTVASEDVTEDVTEDASTVDVADEVDEVDAPVAVGTEDTDDSGDDASRDRWDDSIVLTPEDIDAEAEAAADLLEGLLDALRLDGDLRLHVHDTYAEIEIVDVGDGILIGRRGQTLDAVQDLVRTALQRRFQRRSRVVVDVEGYRARRIEKLLERADEAIARVLETGEPERLEPMDVVERKLVHQRVADTSELASRSIGREPGRRVVVERA